MKDNKTKSKPKEKFVDDGRTVANMNIPGMRGYKNPKIEKHREDMKNLNVSKEEKKAIWKAGMIHLLKVLGIVTFFFAFLYIVGRLIFL